MLSRSRVSNTKVRSPLAVTLLVFFMFSTLFVSTVLAAPWNPGGPPHPYLTPKWAGYVIGGGEALVTADVFPQYGGEEVFHAGGPAQPNSTASGRVTALNGRDGYTIWSKNITGIGDTATLQMADVERDGKLEIIVTLQAPSGLYILNAEDGSTLWSAPGIINGSGGYFTYSPTSSAILGGRIDGSGVIGDTDADGYPDIFIGVMAYEEYPSTGKLIHYEWDGSTIVERGRVSVWHPCAGGLALGDTDNDGIFELYMNERDVYFGDGSWGRGLTSFWANNLTKRWSIYYWGASSDIPMLADVNKDGIVDVVSTNLASGIAVLNSTDGHPLRNSRGTILFNPNLGSIHAHYQSSIYDVDGDGNLELLCADGTHNYLGTQVWDLYDWNLDANIASGYSFRGPSIGEVTGDTRKEIIITTFVSQNNVNSSTIQIYDDNYQLLDSFGDLQYRAIGTVVQDIDRDDGGLNELLVLTQGGVIYCFDTPGLSEESLGRSRARTEVHFYSESRLGVSEYVPYHRPWPDVISPNPASFSVNVSTSLSFLSFTLNHPLGASGETMSYRVTTTPDIGSAFENNVNSGLKSVGISGLAASTTYRWEVEVTDSSLHTTDKVYWFTTAPVYDNVPPTQGAPLLNSTNGGFTNTEDLTAYNQTTIDPDGDKVTNIYNWLKGSGSGISITNLVLPFDTKPSPEAVFSGTATTRDYSGLGNTANVFGATWTSGRVGGAYSFDGNDFVRVEEQSNSLDGGGSWSGVSVEFWIKATSQGDTEKLFSKHSRYNEDSVSYEVDFRYRSGPSRLEFTWGVNTTDGYHSLSYFRTSSLTSWHHIVCTYKSGVGLRIYSDGALVASNLGSGVTGNIVDTDGPLDIGFNNGYDFVGVLDEVRLYPSEISASFVSKRFQDTTGGLSNKSTIPHQDLVIGDVWMCQVTPNDGLHDGQTMLSNQVTIGKVQTKPLIDAYSPLSLVLTVNKGDKVFFTQSSHDPDGDPLTYQWTLNGFNQSNTQNWESPKLNAGNYTVRVTVYDAVLNSVYKEWNITVRPPLNLHVEVVGSGVVNVARDNLIPVGNSTKVLATANNGWILGNWLLDGSIIDYTNPYTVVMDTAHNLTAVFIQLPNKTLFADGFESGAFSAWTGKNTTLGSADVVSAPSGGNGSYTGYFTAITSSSTRWAYCYKSFSSVNELYVSTWIYIAEGLSLSSGKSMWLVQFLGGSNNQPIVSFGIRADSSGTKWAIQYDNLSPYLVPISVSAPTNGQWVHLGAYYARASAGKTIVLTINGKEVAYLRQDTSSSDRVSRTYFGIPYDTGTGSARVFIDDARVEVYTLPLIYYSIGFQSSENDASSNNLGTLTFNNTQYQLPANALKVAGNYTLVYTASLSHYFDHWATTGLASIANLNAQSTVVRVTGNCTVKAVYSTTPTQYSLHIQLSGSGTTSPSGDKLYSAGGSVSIQASPSSGWVLDYWLLDSSNVGSANPYIVTMNGNHVLVAVFKAGSESFPLQGLFLAVPIVAVVLAGLIVYFKKIKQMSIPLASVRLLTLKIKGRTQGRFRDTRTGRFTRRPQ